MTLPLARNGTQSESFVYENGATKLWDLTNGEELFMLPNPSWATSNDFSPDGKYVAVGYNDGDSKIWDAHSGREVWDLRGHSAVVEDVDFSPERKAPADGQR